MAQQDDKGGKPPSSPGRPPITLPGGPLTEDEIPRDPADLFDAIIVDERATGLGVATRPGAIPPMPTMPPLEVELDEDIELQEAPAPPPKAPPVPPAPRPPEVKAEPPKPAPAPVPPKASEPVRPFAKLSEPKPAAAEPGKPAPPSLGLSGLGKGLGSMPMRGSRPTPGFGSTTLIGSGPSLKAPSQPQPAAPAAATLPAAQSAAAAPPASRTGKTDEGPSASGVKTIPVELEVDIDAEAPQPPPAAAKVDALAVTARDGEIDPNVVSAARAPVEAPRASDSATRLSTNPDTTPRPGAPAPMPEALRTRLLSRGAPPPTGPRGQVPSDRPPVPGAPGQVPGDRSSGPAPATPGEPPRTRTTPMSGPSGVPAAQQGARGPSGPVTRTISSPAMAAENPFLRAAQAQIEAWEAELATQPDLFRAARLSYEIGRLYEYPLGDVAQAGTYYLRAHGLAPEFLPVVRGARRTLLAQKNWSRALPLFDTEIRLTSEQKRKAALLAAKASVLLDGLGNEGEARATFAQARDLDPSNVAYLRSLEQLDTRAGSWDQLERTVAQLASAVEKDPRLRSALVARRAHLAEVRLKSVGSSVELLETALDLDPAASGAFAALKRLHHGQSRWRELISVLEREAQQLNDADVRAMAYYRIARIHSERLGSRDKAIAALERSVAESPRYRLVLEELIRLYEAAERYDAMTRTLQALVELLELPSEKISVLYQIGDIVENRLHNEDEAMRWYEQALAIEPAYRPGLRALSKLLTRKKLWDRLLHMLQAEAEAVNDAQRAAAAYTRMAEIHEIQLEDPERAMEYHSRALTLHPGLATSFKALLRLFAAAGRHHELIELLERGIDSAEEDDRRIAYLTRIADLYIDYLNEPVQAAHTYRRILKIDPDHIGAIHALQRACEVAGRYKELVEAIELEASKTLDKPRIVQLLHRAGEVLDEKLDDRDGALVRLRRVLEVDPKYAPALASIGRLYHRTGRWDELLGTYERELAITPPGKAAVALLHTMGGLCESRLADTRRAIGCYRNAIEIDAKHGPSLHALQRLLERNKSWQELVDVLETELRGLSEPRARAQVAYRIGRVYEEHLTDAPRAVVAYQAALQALGDYRPALDGLARVRAALEAWPGVVEDLAQEAAMSKDASLATAALLRAGEVFAEQLGQPERAIAAYERVLEREQGNLAAMLALDALYRQQGMWKSLADLQLRLAKHVGDDGAKVAALRELARLYEGPVGADVDTIRNTYASVLQKSPSDPFALSGLERLAIAARDDQTLARIDAQIVGTEGEDPTLLGAYYTRLGETLERAGSLQSAAKSYEMALVGDPESLGAILGLVRVSTLIDDPRALAAAKARLAAAERSGETAANLLVETAKIRLQRLDDPEAATRDLELALERYPDHAEAADMLYKILLMLEQGTRLLEKLSQAAAAARGAERSAALWLRIAELYADELGNLAGGISVLRRVLRDRPRHVPMLLFLADLYNRNAQWGDAAEIYGEILQVASSPEALFTANRNLAGLLSDHIGDLPRARACLEAALQARPDDRGALLALTDVYARMGDGSAAAETARRLLRASTTIDDRVAAIVHLAHIELHQGRRAQGLEALLSAVALEGPDGVAASEYAKQVQTADDWELYEQALMRHLQQVAGDDAKLGRAYLELARVQGEAMQRSDKAMATLEFGIAEVRQNLPLRLALGERLRAQGLAEQGGTVFRQAAALYPASPDPWRGLVQCYVDRGKMAEAALGLGPLCVLGAASESDMRALTRMTPKPASAIPNSFAPEVLRTHLDRSPQGAVAEKLINAISLSLSKLYLGDLNRFSVNVKEKITARSGNPLRGFVDKIAGLFGLPDYDLYVYRGAGTTVSLEFGALPVVLVPATVLRLSEPQQAFVIARALAYVQRGLQAVTRFKASELMLILAAAARTAAPNYGSNLADPSALDDLQRRIVKVLGRRERQVLQEVSAEYAQSAPVDFHAWYADLKTTSLRAAALIAADLPSCAALLRQEDQALLYLEGEELVFNSEVIADLLRFWCSEGAIELRRRTGLLTQ
ncbi:tetratricopeptide repeat protein [Nannocystis pusilla]|uniref:Tetratricopeptide repeat protein n=1 Tax=Nannocystis pusilla TaxID=889268 RepID=A0ABS7TXX5_9BACT|nr:tetratricopeptide repeat protein [Nannocystis pusilla]